MEQRISVIDGNWQDSECNILENQSNQLADNNLVSFGSQLAILNIGEQNISKEMVIVYFDA